MRYSQTGHKRQYNSAHALKNYVNKGTDTHSEYAHIFFLSNTSMVMPKRLTVTLIDTLPVMLNLALWILCHSEETYWHRLGRRLLILYRLSATKGRRKIIQHLLYVRIFSTAYFGLIIWPSTVSLQVRIQKVWPMICRLPDDCRTIFQNKQQ